ncbi:hypothetical protein A2U01_0104752, partial [Trifolium medium]|nr:hypothetical protein [Trifolium medium]
PAPPQFATACVFCFSPVVAASDYILFGFTKLELNYIFAAQLPVDGSKFSCYDLATNSKLTS